MATRQFDDIDRLKRDRKIEGEIGLDLKIDDGIFVTVLAASDANPRWKANAQRLFAEIDRLRNAGAAESTITRKVAEAYADMLVINWHGGQDEQGNQVPGGPRENGVALPFNRTNCVDWLCEADDALSAIAENCINLKKFRALQAKRVIDQVQSF
jgi:hypothetical protein